ncbi:MAG: DUF4145 domain-containing protein [Akkermansiaceae bacterium]
MSRKLVTKTKDAAKKEVWVPCNGCGSEDSAHECLSYVDASDESSCGRVQWWAQYYVIQCKGCKEISFCKHSQFSEDWDLETGIPETSEQVFPPRISGRSIMKKVYSLPPGIAQIYKETHIAISNSQPVLTGIGLRAIVEAVCHDKKTKERSLFDKINELVAMGVLTTDSATILHKIRIMGNKAAHEVRVNRESELFAAFDVVEHLLTTVYIIPLTAKELK